MNHIFCNGLKGLFSLIFLSTVMFSLSAQEAVDSVATDSLTRELKEVTVQADVVSRMAFLPLIPSQSG